MITLKYGNEKFYSSDLVLLIESGNVKIINWLQMATYDNNMFSVEAGETVNIYVRMLK
jgi:hypothetical protein